MASRIAAQSGRLYVPLPAEPRNQSRGNRHCRDCDRGALYPCICATYVCRPLVTAGVKTDVLGLTYLEIMTLSELYKVHESPTHDAIQGIRHPGALRADQAHAGNELFC